jgi:hypothetical protein
VDDYADTQRLGDGVHGDVVVSRTDPAGGEHIIVARSQRVHRLDDRGGHVRHHAHFDEADALDAQPSRDLRDVLVVSATGEDLVANHDQRGGVDAGRISHVAGLG